MTCPSVSDGVIAVPGFVDAHTHLLKESASIPFPWQGMSLKRFHTKVVAGGSTPMDLIESAPASPLPLMAARIRAGLERAATAGLVEITEMGMRAWWYLDALELLERSGALPVCVRIYLASGLAETVSLPEIGARRSSAGRWVSLDGIKFYADGWLRPRTCATCRPFHDIGGRGILFMDAARLARRIEPFAKDGWRIATHAIGDRAVMTVLDAYDLVWAGDRAAMVAAAPRVEHASIQSGELISRMAESRVIGCIQPSFAVTDAEQVRQALAPDLRGTAYPWAAMAAAGVRMTAGTDYPIEVIEPLVGLARLVNGRALRTGFETTDSAPESSRLGIPAALGLLTDPTAGETLLSADPRAIPAKEIDTVEVRGTSPIAFDRRCSQISSAPQVMP